MDIFWNYTILVRLNYHVSVNRMFCHVVFSFFDLREFKMF